MNRLLIVICCFLLCLSAETPLFCESFVTVESRRIGLEESMPEAVRRIKIIQHPSGYISRMEYRVSREGEEKLVQVITTRETAKGLVINELTEQESYSLTLGTVITLSPWQARISNWGFPEQGSINGFIENNRIIFNAGFGDSPLFSLSWDKEHSVLTQYSTPGKGNLNKPASPALKPRVYAFSLNPEKTGPGIPPDPNSVRCISISSPYTGLWVIEDNPEGITIHKISGSFIKSSPIVLAVNIYLLNLSAHPLPQVLMPQLCAGGPD